ncbi:hypothetical protein BGX23_012431 [Mortierella sp. AD031]|nr:hypothetical protein BGX23_012431 [Mortierella sp. AD031]
MHIVQWYTQRVCVLVTATVFVAQWLFLSQSSPFSPLPPPTLILDQYQQSGSGQGRLRLFTSWTGNQWSRAKSHAANKILYQDGMIDESDDFHDPINTDEDYDADDINTVNDMDGTRRVRIRAAIATTGNWQGELDDGEEDPDYYSDDVRYPWNMPSWFPDWLVNKTLHPSSLWPDPNTAPTTTTSTDNNQEDSPDPSNSVLSKRPRRPAILDIVYTWVNGSDPEWQYSKHVYVQKDPTLCQTSNVKKTESFMESRFRDNNELLHSVRSTFMFGNKIVKKFHIATADVAECVEGHDAEQGQGGEGR